jgi:hypothetical protein
MKESRLSLYFTAILSDSLAERVTFPKLIPLTRSSVFLPDKHLRVSRSKPPAEMASVQVSALPLAERPDIHKSCKSLETVLGIMNDYCEAAGAVVMLQKKLAKALREAAGMKVTAEIPGACLSFVLALSS